MEQENEKQLKNYKTLFIKESDITTRMSKVAYIRPEYHETIQTMCRVAGANGISLFAYIDNVLAHHLDTYGDDMIRFYNESYKGINIKKT